VQTKRYFLRYNIIIYHTFNSYYYQDHKTLNFNNIAPFDTFLRQKNSGRAEQRKQQKNIRKKLQQLTFLIAPFIVYVLCVFCCTVCAVSTQNQRRVVKINVLLDDCNKQSSTQWNFVAPKGFVISLGACRGVKKKTKSRAITIEVKNGVLFCNDKKLTQTIWISPRGGCIQFNGVVYDGDFCIMSYKDTIVCINQVELEDYVTAVLKTESWPGWPLEVNKVFAIACRTYAAYKKLEARRNKQPYDVKNSNVHQTYKGRHDLPVLRDAVEQTRGVVLGFEAKPILAMFDCCCGGIIPAHIADFDFSKVPYLARTYACTYCKQSSLYSWQVSYEQAVFEAIVKSHKQEISRLFDIHIMQKDKAGLVAEVRLRGPRTQIIISGKKLYSMLKEIKSFSFDVYKKSGKIIFTGRGFGHHLGLCQWGARQMIRDGWGYKSILRYYYPGTRFMQLI